MDKEDLARPKLALTEEEAKEEKVKQKQYGDVDKVVGRRKNGRTLEYECTWIGQGEKSVDPRRKNSAKMVEENKYIALETMIEMGYQKQVLECDARIAAANAGLDLRPLITAEIQGHLDDFALDAEFGKSLSLIPYPCLCPCPHTTPSSPTNLIPFIVSFHRYSRKHSSYVWWTKSKISLSCSYVESTAFIGTR